MEGQRRARHFCLRICGKKQTISVNQIDVPIKRGAISLAGSVAQ